MKNWLSKLLGIKSPSPSKHQKQPAEDFITKVLPTLGNAMEMENMFGPFDDVAYERFRNEAGKKLPPDYEAYLRRFNGGIPHGCSLGFLFSMQTTEMEASLLSTLHWALPAGRNRWLTIGRDGAMALFFMSLNEDDFGAIYTCYAWSDAITGAMTFPEEPRRVADCFAALIVG